MKSTLLKTAGLSVLLCTGSAVMAQDGNEGARSAMAPATSAEFGKFIPKTNPVATRIDYEIWDEALKYFVFRMGKSLRESSTRVDPSVGTRRVYGHDSRLRLEGNRVLFSYMTPEIITSLSEYRADLERTADLVDISTLKKNEQLAFWINLHNAAVIEQIAVAYPVGWPSKIKIGDSDLPFDETPFLTVAGVKMSPKDIRTKIVYPNWKDPRVIYGFFRGEIGGPSIQAEAFTSANASNLLAKSATEFVNSLRGTQKNGKNLDVSRIYEEARPFYFNNWEADMREHLSDYAKPEVLALMERATVVRAKIYEDDIADLAKGERDPQYNLVISGDRARGGAVPPAIARLLREHGEKVERIIKRDGRRGEVTFIDISLSGKPREPDEVE